MTTTATRAETLERFRTHVFGTGPQRAASVDVRRLDTLAPAPAGMSVSNLVLTIRGDDATCPVLLTIVSPEGTPDAPTIVALNFRGNHTIAPTTAIAVADEVGAGRFWYDEHTATPQARASLESRWPLADIVSRGYGVATACYLQLGPDSPRIGDTGLYPMLRPEDGGATVGWGGIGMWAWMLSRVLDVLKREDVARRYVALGHSRLGKAALWAAAQDDRFDAVVLNNSGAMGAAVPTTAGAETAELLARVRPYWFCEAFVTWMREYDHPPIGQDALLAAVAPRALYVASAAMDHPADPAGEARGVRIVTESQPTMRVGHHERHGGHDLTAADWSQFLDFLDGALQPVGSSVPGGADR